MKFNKKQKRTILIGLFLIAASLLVWIGYGSEIFTKTQVIVEKQDKHLDFTYKEWKDQFIFGLDYTLAIIAAIVLIASAIVYLERDTKATIGKTK